MCQVRHKTAPANVIPVMNESNLILLELGDRQMVDSRQMGREHEEKPCCLPCQFIESAFAADAFGISVCVHVHLCARA